MTILAILPIMLVMNLSLAPLSDILSACSASLHESSNTFLVLLRSHVTPDRCAASSMVLMISCAKVLVSSL